MAMKSTY